MALTAAADRCVDDDGCRSHVQLLLLLLLLLLLMMMMVMMMMEAMT